MRGMRKELSDCSALFPGAGIAQRPRQSLDGLGLKRRRCGSSRSSTSNWFDAPDRPSKAEALRRAEASVRDDPAHPGLQIPEQVAGFVRLVSGESPRRISRHT